VKFGVVLTPTHDAHSPPAVQLSEHQQVIDLARELEFDVVVAGQHFASPTLRFLQPIPYLAALAEAAGSMRLATGVLLLPLLHPLTVAEEIATLDALTGGRAILGLGIGYAQAEFESFGIDRQRRTDIFEESIGIVRALLSGAEVTHHGEFLELDGVASSTRPVGDVPIWIGAQAHRSVRRAARLADTWYAPPFPTNRELVDLYQTFAAARLESGLPSPSELPVRREVFVAGTRSEARRMAEAATRGRYDTYARWGVDLGSEGTDGGWWNSRLVAGDAPTVVERLTELRRHVPMTHLLFRSGWIGQGHRTSLRQLERLGTQVVPGLRAAG
jgi:alkanesulfonate monooxygenase SsuD/methylene tetrahydromethanopterin reductase-like flavin-dependent oxidoreductase (luciferase family)